PRRTFLRGAGVALALPMLDAMVPALNATARTPTKPARRLGVVYVPNGMSMPYWRKPKGDTFEFGPTLEPLLPFKDTIVRINGLTARPPGGTGGGNHTQASTKFLTGVAAKSTLVGLQAGMSMDQIAARAFAAETQLASLEVGIDGRDVAGACDGSFSCVYA